MTHYRLCESPDPEIDLKRLLKWGRAECRKHGVPISNHIDEQVDICSRKDFYAITDRLQYNRFKITFSTLAFKKYGKDRKSWEDLILHELCHTIRGCYDHRHKWKHWVRHLNENGHSISPYPYSYKKSIGLH